LHHHEDELRDELNVKAVRFIDAGDDLVEYRLRPNLPVVGRKYGKRVPSISRALEALQGDAAGRGEREGEAGNPVEIMAENKRLRLEANDVLVSTSSPQGYEVAENNGLLVARSTTWTPELGIEGQARDLVRFIQDARKSAGLAISNRIDVTMSPRGDLNLDTVVEKFGDYIQAETLSNSLTIGETRAKAHLVEIELDGESAVIGVNLSQG